MDSSRLRGGTAAVYTVCCCARRGREEWRYPRTIRSKLHAHRLPQAHPPEAPVVGPRPMVSTVRHISVVRTRSTVERPLREEHQRHQDHLRGTDREVVRGDARTGCRTALGEARTHEDWHRRQQLQDRNAFAFAPEAPFGPRRTAQAARQRRGRCIAVERRAGRRIAPQRSQRRTLGEGCRDGGSGVNLGATLVARLLHRSTPPLGIRSTPTENIPSFDSPTGEIS